MLLDYVTLLTAVGISAACLSIMIFMGWLMAPKDSYLLTCSLGGGLAGIGLLVYGFYVVNPIPIIGVSAFAVVLWGLSMLVGAGYRFRTDRSPRNLIIALGAGSCAVALPALALGYTGLGFVPINLAMAALMLATAAQYWGTRRHAPFAIAGLCGLYTAIAASFVLCAFMLLRDGSPVIETAPRGWAEDLSLLVMIACVPGIGAVTLALNQARIASKHRLDAMTDPLTGLLNRRALFDAVGERPIAERTAVLVFDIDHFKSINDRHGHAVGDRVIAVFARALEEQRPAAAHAARLGGEEFALVLPAATAEGSLRIAEQVRRSFCTLTAELDIAGLACSASAGIAFGVTHGRTFEQVLNEADAALYAAKNAGRNRVFTAEPRIATTARLLSL
ncbi:MAG: diguanylate cyclase [Xanthobacteraceae bacterium]|nr:diguanylate cyclase [Xanthobacteraceae bacterium]